MKKISIITTIIIVSAVISAGVIYFLNQRNPRLTISVAPKDAFIEIDNKIVGEGKITLKLNRGQYHIGVKKENFLSYESKIILEKDTTINVILQKTPTPFQITAPLPKLTKATWLNDNQLIGYQPQENKTYLIDISSGNWSQLNFNPPEHTTLLAANEPLIIAFAPPTSTTNRAEAKIFNLVTGNTAEIDFGSTIPTLLSLSPNGKQLAFLSDYDYSKQTATINITSVTPEGKISQISRTTLQKPYSSVFWISELVLGLSIYVDAPSSNQLDFFFLTTKSIIESPLRFSTLAVQPKTETIAALTQDNIVIIKPGVNPKKVYQYKSNDTIKFSWISNNQIAIIQQPETTSANITIINIESNESMNTKTNIPEPIQTLIPSPNGTLYFLSPTGILYKLK